MDKESIGYDQVEGIVALLQGKTKYRPLIGIICGTGLGGLSEHIANADVVHYKEIPHFPVSTVEGHKGQLMFGTLENVPVMCMIGRFHRYEGYSLTQCTLPIRVMKLFGVQTLLITNASGALNSMYNVADIMIIRDHIFLPGFSGINPLIGPNDDRFGVRFPPMSKCYDQQLSQLASDCAQQLGMDAFIRKGVYVMQCGPNYETVAEARLLRNFGADAVGMSTVHEVMVAKHCGLRVVAFSLITNKVVTDYEAQKEANNEEVFAAAKKRAIDLENLIMQIVKQISLQNFP